MGPISEVVEITLACGNVVIVDAEDTSLVMSRKWRFRRSGGNKAALSYVTANTDCEQLFLHRLILCAERGQVVDHINGNRLDNRKSNLRFASHTENMRNRAKHRDGILSRFKGVSRFKNGKWRALIRDGSRQRYLGSFTNEVEAAYAYDMASLEIHRDFGRRNFLPLC